MLDEEGICKLIRMDDGTVKVAPYSFRKLFEDEPRHYKDLIDDVDLSVILSEIGDECIIYKQRGDIWVESNMY